jgi:hypothetical protein
VSASEHVLYAISTTSDLDGLELRDRFGIIAYAEPFPNEGDAPA